MLSSSEEEKLCSSLLLSDVDVVMGDKRLNNIAALTYNSNSCKKIFAIIENSLSPTENTWKTIYKALLLLHTIVLYGSELAIDSCIGLCRFVAPLVNYNSALVRKGFFSSTGGIDYGGPVRQTAKCLDAILITDEGIRKARAEARAGQESLVPLGESVVEATNPSIGANMNFGQGLTTSVGAGFGLELVPGMYEGRPDRYFDSEKDPRSSAPTVRDSQHTRDAMAPNLLDLVFDTNDCVTSTNNLPDAQYLPALQRQQELEQQLKAQQEQLQQLQELQQKKDHLLQLQKQQQSLFAQQASQSINNQYYGTSISEPTVMQQQFLHMQQLPMANYQQSMPMQQQSMSNYQQSSQQQPMLMQQQSIPNYQQSIPIQQQPMLTPQQLMPNYQQPNYQQSLPTQQQPMLMSQQSTPSYQQALPLQQQPMLMPQQSTPSYQQALPLQPQPMLMKQPMPLQNYQQSIPMQSPLISLQQQQSPAIVAMMPPPPPIPSWKP